MGFLFVKNFEFLEVPELQNALHGAVGRLVRCISRATGALGIPIVNRK